MRQNFERNEESDNKMADDIDIEEHDLMDNPQLKSIFPCITNIKSEVIDYEEEKEYQEYIDPIKKKVIKTEPTECETNPHINSNVIIFGTKPSTPQPYCIASTSTNKDSMISQLSFEDDHDDDDYSDDTDAEPDIIPCSVVLEDWHSLLVNNNCYCSECKILFPTPNTIEAHRMIAHSLLVAVSNNKAVKSTSKGSVKDFNEINGVTRRPDLKCQHCNIYFQSENDLITHLNSLLPHIKKSSNKSLQAHCDTKVSQKEELYLRCTVCSAFYKYEQTFIAHIVLHHGDRHVEKVIGPFNQYCVHCNACLNSPKKYNCHISVRHTDIYLIRTNYENENYQCHLCKQTFLSAEAERKHRKQEHPINFKHCDVKLRKALMQGIKVESVKTTPHSYKQTYNRKYLKSLSTKNIKTVGNKNITTIMPQKIVVKSEVNTFDENKLVPKSHIFKCNKCQIHYISPYVAFEHAKHCTLNDGNWRCRPCKRTFSLEDKQMHICQHKLFARFKVIIISEEILPRLISRCDKCNVCFDNITFSKYHSTGCKPCPSVVCDDCHLRINKFSVASHLRTHTELGLKRCDYIITDYCQISSESLDSPLKCDDDSEISSGSSASKLVYMCDYNKVYFCPNCKLYVTRQRMQDGHEKGDCIQRKSGRELCKLCGLMFSKKGFITHKAYHKMFNIKLQNLTFVNIISGKRIKPPFPEFMFCSKCNVYFVSKVALQNHVCDTEEHKSCQFCHIKFSDLALKLHLPFHRLASPTIAISKRPPGSEIPSKDTEIGNKRFSALMDVKKSVKVTDTRMPTPIHDLIKKYESLVTVWNILYRCQMCDIVFDSYDGTVEHCQDHFCNMENYNLNIKYCKDCNLKFVDECYDRHEHLHSQNSVGIDSFVIIDCDYSLLLSDEWQLVFNKLSKDQLQQVMSKSIYNEIRGVRMDLLSDGDLGSIYKCSICNVSVDIQFIVDHVKNRECDVADNKFTCNVCSVGFRLKNAANAHAQKHKLSEVPYRIVSFNDPKHLFIDEALIKSAKADDLKFIRCQYCGKLINKSLYRIHMYKHNYRKKMKLMQSKCKSSMVSSLKFKVSQKSLGKKDQKSMYRYYVCTKCNVALLKYNTHVCHNEVVKKKCPKCRVLVNADASSLWRHNRIHENYPTLSHKNIKVTYFNPNEMKKNASKLKADPAPALPKTSSRIWYVRCVHCTKCVNRKNYRAHQCNKTSKIMKCNLCDINIDVRHYKHHLELHKRISFTNNDIIISTFDYKTGEFVSKDSQPQAIKQSEIKISENTEARSDVVGKPDYMRVHKCTDCDLLFVTRGNLVEHLTGFHGACDRGAGERCEYCNLNFHQSDIKQHKTVQFCKTRKVSTINVCTVVLKNTDPNNENNWLSYCKKCDFYNTNVLKRHFNTQHRNAAKTVPCQKCGVQFAILCMRKHNIFHHGRVDIPLSDLNIEVMEDITLEEAGYILKSQNDSLNESQISVDEDSVDKKITKKYRGANTTTKAEHKNIIPDVYRCSICNLHFNHRASLYSHQLRSEHNVEQVPCKTCGMTFSRTTIKKHFMMHEFTNTFNIIDNLERSTIRKSWSNSNTSLNTSDALDSEPTTSESAVSADVCKEPDVSKEKELQANKPSQSNLPISDTKTREVADSSGTSSNEISSTNSISHANTKAELKLFKCGVCDVYFLTAECCSYHTDNHSPLDPTEYIACKICDLQFLNRSLDVHMKCHREMTFNMDTLVVDEYHPDGQSVRIDTYSAIDRLKSKLVSTTTESD